MTKSIDLIRETLAAHDIDGDTVIAYTRLKPIDGEHFRVAIARRPGSFYVTTIDATAGTIDALKVINAAPSQASVDAAFNA